MKATTKRRARRVALLSIALSAMITAAARAQDREHASDWARVGTGCQPDCRQGYRCVRGECVPSCSTPCPEGFICGAEAGCIQAAAATPARASHQPATNACEPTCRSGYTCLGQRCVSLCNPVCAASEICSAFGECLPANQSAPDPDDAAPEPPRDSIVNLHLDVAGALQFGVTPSLEVGERVSGYVRLRVANAGLASHFLLGRDADDRLDLGLGAALGVHWFTATRGNMRGAYAGLALEYAYLQTRDSVRDFARYRTHALIPQLDFGYRWAYRAWFVGVAGKLGLAIPLANDVEGLGEQPCRLRDSCTRELGVAVIPGIGVDLGWFLPR